MAKKHLKPTLLSSAVAAGLMATSMPADALSLKISGQISKLWQLDVDDGVNSGSFIGDNINSGTRFRFTGTEDMGNGLMIGGVWEWQWSNTPSSAANFNSDGEISDASASLGDRKAEITFAGGFGKISFGKGDGAANGTQEVDVSGTGIASYPNAVADQNGSFQFGTATDVLTASGTVVKTLFPNIDGESRNSRVRYDTPKFIGGLVLSGSLGNEGLTEFAARYTATVGAGKLALAFGSTDTGDRVAGTNRERTMLSGGYLFGNGFNVGLSHAENSPSVGPTGERDWIKVGYKKGKHAVALVAGTSDDQAGVVGTDGDETALAYVYKTKPLELWATFRTLESDVATDTDDVEALIVGSRIKWK